MLHESEAVETGAQRAVTCRDATTAPAPARECEPRTSWRWEAARRIRRLQNATSQDARYPPLSRTYKFAMTNSVSAPLADTRSGSPSLVEHACRCRLGRAMTSVRSVRRFCNCSRRGRRVATGRRSTSPRSTASERDERPPPDRALASQADLSAAAGRKRTQNLMNQRISQQIHGTGQRKTHVGSTVWQHNVGAPA